MTVPSRVPIRVLVADDHTLVRQGLVVLLEDGGVCRVIAQAADGQEAVEKTLGHHPDVAVVDLTMPRLSGLEAVRRIRQEAPQTRVLVVTVHEEEEYVLPIVRAGAAGYLVKDSAASELLDAVRAVASGQTWYGLQAAKALAEQYRRPPGSADDPYEDLTPREREVLHLVAEGKTTKEIGKTLGISPKTADNHRTRMMDKLGLHNTAEVVRYAARKGLIG